MITPILVVVPPTSKYIAFEALRYISEPITDAAGPDNAVSMGRFLISFISITPPSPRIIISGTDTPAPLTEDSVAFAVAIIFGSIDAFIAAVLVLLVSPYSLVISDAIVTGIFFFEAKSCIFCSSSILSTPKAIEATITSVP